MKKLIVCLWLVAGAPARADTLSLDPVSGAVGFTGKNLADWSITYERELAPEHALVVEQTNVHVHDDPWHLTLVGIGVGYRRFWGGAFVGAIAGGKIGFGRFGEMDDLSARALYATAHAGYRWVRGRIAITLRIGAGYARYMIPDDAPAGAHAMEGETLEPLPFELDSEIGIGWRF